MLKTPEDFLHEALGTIASQCQMIQNSAMAMNTERLRNENIALQKAVAFLGIIEKYVVKPT
jgi:hypothetical protein